MFAAKVWCPKDECKPDGLFNRVSCPEAPPNWFREAPEDAAELFGMERWRQGEHEVHVIDTAGVLHRFTVRVGHELTASVRATA